MVRFSGSSAAQSTMLLTSVNLFSQLVAFFYRIALSRMIGAEGMGLFQLVFPVYSMIMALCVSGLATAVNRLSAEAIALGQRITAQRLVHTAIGVFLLLLSPIALLIALGSDYIACELLGDARTQLGILLLTPCVLMTGLENMRKHYFYGHKDVVPPAVSEIVEQLIRTGSVLSLLYWIRPVHEEDAVGLILCGMILCEVASAALLHLFYCRKKSRERSAPSGPTPDARHILSKLLSVAIPIGLTSLLGTLIGSIGAIMIPGRLAASGLDHGQALQLYGVLFGMSMQLLGLPNVFLNSLSLVMIPRLAECLSSGSEARLKQRARRTMEISSLFVFGVLPLLGTVGAPLTRALFHNPQAGDHFGLLVLGAALGCYQLITTNLLSAIGLQGRGAVFVLLGDLVQLALTWLWVADPALRLRGYAIAALIGVALTLLLNVATLWRRIGPPIPLQTGIIKPALFSAASVCCTAALYRLLPFMSDVARCCLALVLGLVVYLLLASKYLPLKKRQT